MKNITKLTINNWSDYNHKLHSNNISNLDIAIAFSKFITQVISTLSDYKPVNYPSNIRILILFKVKTINNQYRNISPLQIVEIENLNILIEIFNEYWNLKSEEYYIASYSDIIFTYKIVDSKNLETKILTAEKINKIKKQLRDNNSITRFGGYSLPNTMDFTTWGDCHFLSDSKIIVYKRNSKLEFYIELSENYQEVELRFDDKVLLSFKDTMLDRRSGDLSSFSRLIKNRHEYFFNKGNLILKKIIKKVKFIKQIRKSNHLSDKFLTMDLETRVINEEMSSYCVSIYDGKKFKSFYITDYTGPNAEKDMLKDSIKYLMKRKYDNHKIYLHNFSRFDAVFLLTVMTDLTDKVSPIMRDGKYIDLRLAFAGKYTLYFRDSLLLLPSSLRKLTKNFLGGTTEELSKGLFPYKFLNNKDISLDYTGEIPDILYFDNISQDEYSQYSNNLNSKEWNLKEEAIKYCELDCFVLYKVILTFSKKIFELFRIDLFNYPTLPSLAFAIFRSKFLKLNKIPLIHGEMFEFIKESYTGGSVDVYKPTSDGKKVYRYDVNSLYPYVMKKYPMPTGIPIYFEGNILSLNTSNEDRPFGIFEVDIISPDNIKTPILQTRIKTDNGFRTIAPWGNWSGKYFSDELYNAQKFGYKFKVKRGYLFEKSDIFSEYVDFLYELKKNSEKGSANYIISKLLLNSLYGRLGMNPVVEQHLILENSKAKEIYSKVDITNVLDLKNGKELISFYNSNLDSDTDYNIKNISVAVSAIVTASARIHMTRFKTDNNLTIYYTDTDSIDIDKELDKKYVGNELGQMKLEHIFDDVVFLSPKVYGGKNLDYEYVRIKGLKTPITFKEIKTLLKKDSKLKINQEKWYADISNGKFHVKDEIYTLMVTENKRKLLYNEDNIFYDTAPLKLKDGLIVK